MDAISSHIPIDPTYNHIPNITQMQILYQVVTKTPNHQTPNTKHFPRRRPTTFHALHHTHVLPCATAWLLACPHVRPAPMEGERWYAHRHTETPHARMHTPTSLNKPSGGRLRNIFSPRSCILGKALADITILQYSLSLATLA